MPSRTNSRSGPNGSSLVAPGNSASYALFAQKEGAYVISGGNVRDNATVTDDVILTLERKAFIECLKQEKTMARIEHMLQTGKPLRN